MVDTDGGAQIICTLCLECHFGRSQIRHKDTASHVHEILISDKTVSLYRYLLKKPKNVLDLYHFCTYKQLRFLLSPSAAFPMHCKSYSSRKVDRRGLEKVTEASVGT